MRRLLLPSLSCMLGCGLDTFGLAGADSTTTPNSTSSATVVATITGTAPTTGDLTDTTGAQASTSSTGEAPGSTTATSTGEAPQAICNNGMLEGDEECDEFTENCDASCRLKWLYVFITLGSVPGAMGGTTGADEICNEEATAYGLPGIYRAWLSAGVDDTPLVRFNSGDLVYRLPDTTRVADNLAQLVQTGVLMAPIDRTADDVPLTPDAGGCQNLVWTGTDASGDATASRCAGFTSNQPSHTATMGNFAAVNSEWTVDCSLTCDSYARIYCFQQKP